MSRRESIILLLVALYCNRLLFSYCKEIQPEKTPTSQISWRQEKAPGNRTVDALSGRCGKFSAIDSWNKRKDAFCDKEAESGIDKIRPVNLGEYPSYVKLEIRYPGKTADCSGVLIHENSILTANACIQSEARSLRATAGMDDTSTLDGTQQSYAWGYCRLFNKKKYEDYEDNNVVMVLLRKPFSFNQRVQPACVEPRRTRNNKVNCYITVLGNKKGSNETDIFSVPFLPCSSPEQYDTKSWDLNSGQCFYREVGDQQLEDGAISVGSGLYCLDKCDKSPVVFAVGIVARAIGIDKKRNLTIEIISVSKTEQYQAPTIGMLQNCVEFVRD